MNFVNREQRAGSTLYNMNPKEKYEDMPKWVKRAEFKLDRFNHLMELARTCLAGCTLVLQIVILLKLLEVI